MTAQPAVLTNNLNLMAFASRGLLAPPEAFSKYYRDLSSDAGGLRIVTVPVSVVDVQNVTAEAPDLHAVLLVLPEKAGPAKAGSVTACAIPLTEVVEIRVPDDATADLLSSAAYSDARMDLPVRVHPGSFDGPVCDPPAHVGAQEPPPDYATPDRLTGGIVAVLATASPDRDFARHLSRLLADPASVPGWIPEGERGLYSALRDFLMNEDPGRRPTSKALSRLRTSMGESDALPGGWPAYMDRIAEVLRGSVEPDRFRPDGLVVMKALLIALLRPSVERLLADNDQLGADMPVRRTAALFVGFQQARSRMALEHRPPALDTWLAGREVALINEGLTDLRSPQAVTAATVTEVDDDGPQLLISVGAMELWRSPVRDADPLAGMAPGQALSDEAVRAARARDWDDLLVTVVTGVRTMEVDADGDELTLRLTGPACQHVEIDADGLEQRREEAEHRPRES